MSEPITAVVLGAGDRGHRYSEFAQIDPSALNIVGVADPRPDWRQSLSTQHHIPVTHCFDSWEALLEQPQMANTAIITLPDRLHHDAAITAMRAGYDVLLEKPMSPLLAENVDLIRAASETGQLLQVCHVLRFTRFFRTVRDIIQGGRLGQLIHVDHKEHVGYWHMAHSYVRGNWRNQAQSGPMILSKCCHDLDILNWLTGVPAVQVSSFGSLTHFTAANKPDGAPTHCVSGCPVADTCLYDAVRQYANDTTGWPCDIVSLDNRPEVRREILKTSPYGRCVYQCDNDVVDHQVVNLLLANGTTVTLTMHGHAHEDHRSLHYEGTCGTLVGKFSNHGSWLKVYDHLTDEVVDFDVNDANPSHHGGGDLGLIASFVNAVRGQADDSLSTARESLESHLLAFAAEESRLQGSIINMAQFRAQHAPELY